MVQNRLKEAELQLNTNSTNYKTALQSLNIMMGVEPDAAVVLTDSIQKVLWVPKQEGLNKALERRADYQSAIMGIEMAKLQTDMARSKYLPQLAVGIKEKYGTTSYRNRSVFLRFCLPFDKKDVLKAMNLRSQFSPIIPLREKIGNYDPFRPVMDQRTGKKPAQGPGK